MACTPPIGTSPGKLVLYYINTIQNINASVSWDLIAGTDINAVNLLGAEAQRLATLLGPCMITGVQITDWAIKIAGGGTYYGSPLIFPVTGTHGDGTSMQRWHSTTVAFVGTGNQAAAGICHGHSISRIHTFGALSFTPGMKYFNASDDAAYLAFITSGLNASTYLPADSYGQQADIKLEMPVQWNAAYQKKQGS